VGDDENAQGDFEVGGRESRRREWKGREGESRI
jgi:hypothetical protein